MCQYLPEKMLHDNVLSDPIDISNMIKICRFCLCNDVDLKPILQTEDAKDIIEMTANCIGIKISTDDEYSKYVCENCLKQLIACNTFRIQCLRSMENYDKSKLEVKVENEDGFEEKPIHTDDFVIFNINTEPEKEIKKINVISVDDTKKTNQEHQLRVRTSNKCPHCNEWRVDLKKHIKRMHTTGKIEKSSEPKGKKVCYICGLSVTGLSNHLVSHNIDGVEYACAYCGKIFKSKYLLLAHFKIHLNKREYKCTLCPKAFNQDKSLRVHMCHHTGEKRYECETCHRRFAQASGLSKHIPSHLKIYKFPCTICGKKFTRNSGRKKHEKSHSDDHPYHCKYCPKTFKACSSYSVHMTKHFKDNPLKCDICDGSFYRLSDYKTHKRQHEYNII